ncbi:unnamed protein product [Sphagnum jensenii]|uniref:Protein kinase domain-containing protein n=1 Tax=Sphagnum jensenii TaxID=128206 RepID=A0ABP1AQ91_9BRYO
MNSVACGRVPGGLQTRRELSSATVSTTSSSSSPSSSPSPSSESAAEIVQQCPALNFTALDQFPYIARQAGDESIETAERCLAVFHGLEMVLSEYLRQTGFFLVPAEMASACVQAYEIQLAKQGVASAANFSNMCKFSATTIARGTDNCKHVQTVHDFRKLLSDSVLATVNTSCNGVLGVGNSHSTLCPACIKEMFSASADLEMQANGNGFSCYNYTTLYVGAYLQQAGPLDPTAVVCLWDVLPYSVQNRSSLVLYLIIGATSMVVVSAGAAILIFYIHRRRDIAKQLAYMKQMTHRMAQDSTCVNADFAMVWYSLDEIKAATHNFARERVLGSGGFANVYRGVLEDQTDVAVKRFKNCSPTGVHDFVHEVEALASVKHKNLVTLRGCCIATVGTGVEADHQRIIVCDFMENGSLHNFLFSPASAAAAAAPDVESKPRFLDWPTRQKIAIDMARGIDYLHHGAQPPILHRDIKSSNILLDSNFNARVADFGLAKFTPEGMTHMITRTAGTFGYIAPEYALYGQLSERSDVYSFGVVLLELISGRKAVQIIVSDPAAGDDGKGGFSFITGWANALVKSGNWLQVVDPRMMNNLDSQGNRNDDLEDMHRFLMLALLCAHPEAACRPTITVARRLLEDARQQMPVVPPHDTVAAAAVGRFASNLQSRKSRRFSEGGGGGGLTASCATVSSMDTSYMAR